MMKQNNSNFLFPRPRLFTDHLTHTNLHLTPIDTTPPLHTLSTHDPQSEIPWDGTGDGHGWFSRFLQEKLGEERYQKLRSVMLFRADDHHQLGPGPRNARVGMPGVPRIQGFRYPSPGQREAAQIPTSDLDNDPYNIAFYPRDTVRNKPLDRIRIQGSSMTKDEHLAHLAHRDAHIEEYTETVEEAREVAKNLPEAEAAKYLVPFDGGLTKVTRRATTTKESRLASYKKGSPGNKGVFATGPSSFDPSGLRATMSTNWAAMYGELEKHRPTQLVRYEWWDEQDDIIAKYEAKGIPPPPGRPQPLNVPERARVASW